MRQQTAPFTSLRPAFRFKIAAIVVCGLLTACEKQPEKAATTAPQLVQLVSVMPTDSQALREFSGRVEQTSISPLAFEVTGRIVQIAVLDGSIVRKGQLIARIDPEPFELQLRRAEAQYTQLSDDLKRKAVLHDQGILSGAAFDQLKAAADMAGAQRDLALRDMRNTRLIAPFDGRLSRRNVETQQTVQAGMPVFDLENVERIAIGIELPQGIAERLSNENTLHAQAWLPERPRDVFDLVYRERAMQATASSNSYRFLFSVKQPINLSLLPGMAVRVRMEVAQPQAANTRFSVPVSALSLTPDGHDRLWRYDSKSGHVHAVPITLQEIRDDSAVVEGALQPGDQVVGGGSQLVTEGQAVRSTDASP
ncbi:RND family efflux transporter MFP subunit [Paraburkholderia sp. BL27I4N3]|uniref:efflux RND transporter periplasmic adaptor subunit n=1 Tax=Paraburkholderia sp. BL27I4N3 TaxID=1938805 RepID=UPI000E21E10E|nr:efflux RND transporter periplasmic adaptor subunit [Paraburkholderia sp. BL27I4N3]REE18380.1 RND family efflux transporter MFP subunit [Paraburkholderia sp. BL27I4N3]